MLQNNSTNREYLIIALLVLILLFIVFYLIQSENKEHDYRQDYAYKYNTRHSSSLQRKFVNESKSSSLNQDSSYYKY